MGRHLIAGFAAQVTSKNPVVRCRAIAFLRSLASFPWATTPARCRSPQTEGCGPPAHASPPRFRRVTRRAGRPNSEEKHTVVAVIQMFIRSCTRAELRYNPHIRAKESSERGPALRTEAGQAGPAKEVHPFCTRAVDFRRELFMGLAERRREARESCRVEVQCAGSDSLFRGTLLNLSATGGYLETAAQTPPEGASLTLLWRAGAKKIQAEAVVVWSHDSGSVGLRFIDRLPTTVVRDSRHKG